MIKMAASSADAAQMTFKQVEQRLISIKSQLETLQTTLFSDFSHTTHDDSKILHRKIDYFDHRRSVLQAWCEKSDLEIKSLTTTAKHLMTQLQHEKIRHRHRSAARTQFLPPHPHLLPSRTRHQPSKRPRAPPPQKQTRGHPSQQASRARSPLRRENPLHPLHQRPDQLLQRHAGGLARETTRRRQRLLSPSSEPTRISCPPHRIPARRRARSRSPHFRLENRSCDK